MILSHLFASSLQVQRPHLTCQQHPGACPAWPGQLIAYRKPLANLDRRIVLALHLEEQHQVDHKGDGIDFDVHKQLGTP